MLESTIGILSEFVLHYLLSYIIQIVAFGIGVVIVISGFNSGNYDSVVGGFILSAIGVAMMIAEKRR